MKQHYKNRMTVSKENYKSDLGVKGLKNDLIVLLYGEIRCWSL